MAIKRKNYFCKEDGTPYTARLFREKCYYPALEKSESAHSLHTVQGTHVRQCYQQQVHAQKIFKKYLVIPTMILPQTHIYTKVSTP